MADDPSFVADFRRRSRMTQRQLALELGVAQRTIEEWEGKRNRPPAYLKLALAALSARIEPWS